MKVRIQVFEINNKKEDDLQIEMVEIVGESNYLTYKYDVCLFSKLYELLNCNMTYHCVFDLRTYGFMF